MLLGKAGKKLLRTLPDKTPPKMAEDDDPIPPGIGNLNA